MGKISVFVLGSISLIIRRYVEQYKEQDLRTSLSELEPDLGLPRIDTYDFIIVGAGTAGCLLAGRLSVFFRVLLLETGGPPPTTVNNPYFFRQYLDDPSINYLFTTRQKYISLESGGIFNFSQGRMMGGSGSHNYNGYARGSPLDYDTSRDIGILINEDKMAYGVTYLRHGIPQIAHASRDVIISAGAILSPLMLMKSGVGPPQILRDANIPIHEALPGVGQNLGDHPLAQLTFEIGNAAAAAAFDAILPESDFEKELIKFHSTPRDGVFAKIRAQQAFLVSSRAKENGEKGWPDILLISTLFPEQNTSQMYFSIALGRPRSRGSVTLNRKAYLSREVNDENLAAIDLGSLADHTDLEVMLEALRMVLKIKETSAFKRLDLKLSSVIPPSCKIYRFDSNNFWKCYITHTTKTFWHYSGTCKMGPKSDPFAVVDSKFRVFGIRALRVVDASVLPMSTGSNTNAPTLLVAEKAACCILRNHLQPNFGDKFCPLDYPWLFKPVVDPHK